MTKRLAIVFLVGLASTVLLAPAAYAHGERSQEAFLRMRTVGWTDVEFSGGEVKEGETYLAQGDRFTLSGVAKLMNTWPDTLAAGQPDIGYVNIATQGPVVAMLERTVNGVSTPGRIEVERGQYYQFEMTLMGRRPGRWHVHPSFAVKGAGTVLGPGQWINVAKTAGGFTTPVSLYNGDTINLENYGLNMVWGFQIFGFLIGMVWVIWWTGGSMIAMPKLGPKWHRTVTNPAVTLQIPLNDDGVAVGLNKKSDHRFCNIMALFTALFLLVGWIYQASAYPVKIPQQVVQFAPPVTELDKAPVLAEVNPQKATYDGDAQLMTVEVEVTNVHDGPIELAQFTTSTLSFVAAGATATAPEAYQNELKVSPSGAIQPGQTSALTLEIQGSAFEDEHLVPTGESQLTVSGLLVFEDQAGNRGSVEMEEPLQPRYE